MQLLSLVSQVSKLWLAAAILASTLSGFATLATLICVFQSLRTDHVWWWQFILIGAFSVLCRSFAQFLINRLTASSVLRLRRRLIRSIIHVPLRDLERTGSERLLAAFTTDLSSVATAVRNFVSVFASAAFLVACMSYLAWLSIARMAVVATVMAICIIGAILLRYNERAARKAARETWDQVVRVFMMVLDGVKQLKLRRSLARKVLSAFETGARAQKSEIGPRTRNYSDAVSTWVQSMFLVMLGLAVFIPYGDNVELRTAFGLLAILYLRGPLRSVIQDSAGFSDATIALRRINELGLTLDEDREDDRNPQSPAHKLPTRNWQRLTFREVTFSYDGGHSEDDFMFGPLNITLQPAAIVFVAGGNGSGKTTFAKLLTGLYAPTAGSITFDDAIVDDDTIRQYRSKFAVVFSDFCLFEGVAGMEPEEIGPETERLAARLKLKKWMLTGQSNGGSAELSAGERRRVALLMALIEDRPIVVFDEWAADQDPHYKELFYREILPSLRAGGKLVVALSHDERFFHLADRVLWLERGEPPVWREPGSFAGTVEVAANRLAD